MAFTGPIEDRLAIHELVASHGDAVTTRDADAWIANGAEVTVWKLHAIPGMEMIAGLATIIDAWLNRYEDEWVKRAGPWLFTSRSLTVLRIGPG